MTHYTMSPEDPSIQWRIIPGFEGRYEASDTGLIRRSRPSRTYPALSLITTRLTAEGYVSAALRLNNKWVHRNVHRLMMLAFYGIPPEGIEVNHIDGNKANNLLSNLEYVTHKQNIQHAIDNLGMRPFGDFDTSVIRGTRHGLAKLDDNKVREIRRLFENGMSLQALARQFGVAYQTISAAVIRKTWTHVE